MLEIGCTDQWGYLCTRIGGNKSVSTEPLRTAAALLAGFRVRPETPNELQILGPLLERLLPGVERVFADFLQWTFERPFDGAVVVPPLGQHLNGAQFSRFELAKRGGRLRTRVAAELLFVEHALAAIAEGGLLVTVLPEGLLSSVGHADFREWLLKHARLLAVVSLPAGSCFSGTGVKCSVVLLRKRAPAADYPILMLDVDAENLCEDVENAKSKLEEFLEREVATCA